MTSVGIGVPAVLPPLLEPPLELELLELELLPELLELELLLEPLDELLELEPLDELLELELLPELEPLELELDPAPPSLDPLLEPELELPLAPELEPLPELEPELEPLLEPELEPLPEPVASLPASLPALAPELDPLLELPPVSSSPSSLELEEPHAAMRAAADTSSARFRERARMRDTYLLLAQHLGLALDNVGERGGTELRIAAARLTQDGLPSSSTAGGETRGLALRARGEGDVRY